MVRSSLWVKSGAQRAPVVFGTAKKTIASFVCGQHTPPGFLGI
jgi:hypothetical protein